MTGTVVTLQIELPPSLASHLGSDATYHTDLDSFCRSDLAPLVIAWTRARVLRGATSVEDEPDPRNPEE